MRLSAVSLAALVTLCVPDLDAQQTGLPARLSPATRGTIERLADSLRAAGLPHEPLISKANEGVLKGADDARILVAVRALARQLGASHAALGASATPAEIVAGASALHAGAQAEALRRLRRTQSAASSPSHSLAMAIVVLADLITRGVPPDTATASVDALVARGVADGQFGELRRSVERDIDAGLPPGAAAASRARAMSGGVPRRP